MKIRKNFVSNSSSSSFVIALNKQYTNEKLFEIIESKLNDKIIKQIREEFDYESDKIFCDNLLDYYAHILFNDIKRNFISNDFYLELNDWLISASELGSEASDSLLSYLLYDLGIDFDTSVLKTKATSY